MNTQYLIEVSTINVIDCEKCFVNFVCSHTSELITARVLLRRTGGATMQIMAVNNKASPRRTIPKAFRDGQALINKNSDAASTAWYWSSLGSGEKIWS